MKALSKDNLKKFKDYVEDINVCMFTTHTNNEELFARPMATADIDDDGNLYFFSDSSTDKHNEIKENSRVNLSYVDKDENTFVSVSGFAVPSDNKEKMKELWNPAYKAWYPDGLDTDGIELIVVRPETVNYWDGTSSRMVQLFKIAQAVVTGDQYDGGDHGVMR